MYKPIFHRYLLIGCGYNTHRSRCLELEIWWFRADDNDNDDRRTNRLLYPCACAWGKSMHLWKSVHVRWTTTGLSVQYIALTCTRTSQIRYSVFYYATSRVYDIPRVHGVCTTCFCFEYGFIIVQITWLHLFSTNETESVPCVYSNELYIHVIHISRRLRT